jgi:hypothetical protein
LEIDSGFAGPIAVESFNTESGYDKLTVNGMEYDGTTGPSGITPTTFIVWSSDSDATLGGWRLCMEEPMPTPTPASEQALCPDACWAFGFLGDGICDDACNSWQCNYDEGDCGDTPVTADDDSGTDWVIVVVGIGIGIVVVILASVTIWVCVCRAQTNDAPPDVEGQLVQKKGKTVKKSPPGKVEPMTDAGPTPSNDTRLAVIGVDRRCFPGGMLDVRSCHFGEIDALMIPLVNIHNFCVDAHNSLVCFKERARELGAEHTFKFVLGETTERCAAQGWEDSDCDFMYRIVAKGATITHAATADFQIVDAEGTALSKEQVIGLEAKMPGLGAQFTKLRECQNQFAFYFAKKENQPNFKYGPFSLALHNVGGLQVLRVLRLPSNIRGDAKPPMFPDLWALKYCSNGYPRDPNPELQTAVDAFNNAAFEIRNILNKDVTAGSVIKDAISKIKLLNIDPSLVITVNGLRLDLEFVKKLSKSLASGAINETNEQATAATSGKCSMKDLKMPKIPSMQDVMGIGDGILEKLASGALNVDFELKPSLEDIMSEDPNSYLKDLPKKTREVIDALAGSRSESLKNQITEAFSFLKDLVNPNAEDIPEGELTFEQKEGASLPPWYHGETEKVGKGSAVKYPTSLPKLFEKVPELAEKMQAFLSELVGDPQGAIKPMSMGGKIPDKGLVGAVAVPGRIMNYGAAVAKLPGLVMAILGAIVKTLTESLEGFWEGAKALKAAESHAD